MTPEEKAIEAYFKEFNYRNEERITQSFINTAKKSSWTKGYKAALTKYDSEGWVKKNEVKDLLQTILNGRYESFENAHRQSVVPVEFIKTSFDEYFSIKENESPF